MLTVKFQREKQILADATVNPQYLSEQTPAPVIFLQAG
jgi:hypothetical protein